MDMTLPPGLAARDQADDLTGRTLRGTNFQEARMAEVVERPDQALRRDPRETARHLGREGDHRWRSSRTSPTTSPGGYGETLSGPLAIPGHRRPPRRGPPRKPDPSSALEIAADLAIDPAACLFVGDSGVDMRDRARNAGMIPVGVTWGFQPESRRSESAGARAIIDLPSRTARTLRPWNRTG